MRPLIALALVLIAPLIASAQVQSRPTDPPLVTADRESWYAQGEPVLAPDAILVDTQPLGERPSVAAGGAEEGTRTPTPSRGADFKSAASAVSPPRQRSCAGFPILP